MRRRDLLRGAVAGLLGCAAPAALLDGEAFADGGIVPDGRLVAIRAGETVLSRRAVEKMAADSVTLSELEGGTIVITIRDDLRVFRQQMRALGPDAAPAARSMATEVRRQLRKVAVEHWRRR
jgi:hypothetical protein